MALLLRGEPLPPQNPIPYLKNLVKYVADVEVGCEDYDDDEEEVEDWRDVGCGHCCCGDYCYPLCFGGGMQVVVRSSWWRNHHYPAGVVLALVLAL